MTKINDPKKYSITLGGKEVILETGRLAKQADGAVFVSCEGSQVLVTVCSATDAKDGQDFFPLMVDYTEKFYAAGKFLGGFLKREGRPSTAETLNSRLIDRPIRPLFPEGYMCETIVQATVHSYSETADTEVLAALGVAAALGVSDIPFAGPMGTVKVGRINGELKINPSQAEWAESDLDLVVSASKDAILMVEGEAKELTEKEMFEAIKFAHNAIKEFCGVVDKMVAECGRPKRHFESAAPNETLMNKTRSEFTGDARNVLNVEVKQDRSKATKALEKKVAEAIKGDIAAFGLTEDDCPKKAANKAVDELLYELMRGDILKEGKRIANRGLTEVRSIETEVDVLSKPHGSALFTRGETQVLASATIGGSEGDQMVDRIVGLSYQKFYLHYAMPPFAVGEARGVRGVGRRELGHGNLAERAIKGVLPSDDEWKYTMRVYCEVTESNGSSSMGSVCSGCMALMDAGVPLKDLVAGVAMGLIKEGEDFKILTDILGDEDHLGDMDFKVAGTSKGITAIQMDIKITGITDQIFQDALEQAREGRLHILEEMKKTIDRPRADLKAGVPVMLFTKIAPDKIGALIGPGGKNIKSLQENFAVNIEVAEDGEVKVLGTDQPKIKEVIELIDLQINGPKKDTEYDGIAVSIKEYGAFVDIAPGISGLLHISELTDSRVKDVEEYLKEGDSVKVKVLDVDRFGKIKLSAKAVKPLEKRAD